jgi:hypothetical protein
MVCKFVYFHVKAIDLVFAGNTGHGSRFIEKTAAEKLQRLLNRMLAYREEQKAK